MRPKKVILCVDGNEQALSVRTFLLETRGYRVLPVSTSQEALDVLEHTVRGTLDLLIADLLLPGMDGNQLVRKAKQMHPWLPALIVSRTVATYDRALAADAFLPKGAGTAAELLERVRILVARKRGPRAGEKHAESRLAGERAAVQAVSSRELECMAVGDAVCA